MNASPETPSPKPAHTPVPWHTGGLEGTGIYDSDGNLVTERKSGKEPNRANARHIVRCVNLMPRMVEMLGELSNLFWRAPADTPDHSFHAVGAQGALVKKLRALLSEAEN